MVNNQPLSGGRLIFYLKNHRTEVLSYFRKNGHPATLKHYRISATTLERLMGGVYGKENPLSDVDRALALAEIAIAGNSELRREINEMRNEYNKFVELIANQLASLFAETIRNTDFKLPMDPGIIVDDDPLRLK